MNVAVTLSSRDYDAVLFDLDGVQYFLGQLEPHGVEPYEPAIALVRALRAYEVKTAVRCVFDPHRATISESVQVHHRLGCARTRSRQSRLDAPGCRSRSASAPGIGTRNSESIKLSEGADQNE